MRTVENRVAHYTYRKCDPGRVGLFGVEGYAEEEVYCRGEADKVPGAALEETPAETTGTTQNRLTGKKPGKTSDTIALGIVSH